MDLYNFIRELKHKNLHVDLFINAKFLYTGSVGQLVYWNLYSKYSNYRIDKIEPLITSLNIFLEDKK